MEWVWPLYEPYIRKQLERLGETEPAQDVLQRGFLNALRETTVTVLVQEPWRGSVRFKTLARYGAADMFGLLNDPEEFLLEHFGGGKFKLNFHCGWNFVATQNFKPEGAPRWRDMPALDPDP